MKECQSVRNYTPNVKLLFKKIQPLLLGNDKFLLKDDFKSLLSTIVLFLDQETYFNAPMNLDVNFRHVRQDNLTEGDGANIKDSILEDNGKSFQNSPLCLMFYEKINV